MIVTIIAALVALVIGGAAGLFGYKTLPYYQRYQQTIDTDL